MFRLKLNTKIASLLFVILLLNSYYCSVRKHTNVFDPKSGIDTLDMKLELRRADSVISFSWSPHYQAEIKGFHLYRKAGEASQFSSLAVLPDTTTQYCDSLVQFDKPYAYYLTLIGASGESPPTPILKTVPGPGQIWILDRWNEYILKFSYDMQHILLRHYAIWIPQALALDPQQATALVTYPAYHYVEILNPMAGILQAEITSIRYPFACAFNPAKQEFWLSDSSGMLYRFTPPHTLAQISSALGKPVEIAFDAQGRAVVLDKKSHSLFLFSQEGTQRGLISTFNGKRFSHLKFLCANPAGSAFYFIDQRDTSDVLYRLTALNDSVSLLLQEPGLVAVREDPHDHSLWVAVNAPSDARILQLSPGGLRLNTLYGFKFITDLAINRINGNLVIADWQAHRVVHLRTDGSIIGAFKPAPYPFKVYFE